MLACLTAWSSSALLEPFCWWSAPEDGSATLAVIRVERGEHHAELLADALAGADPEDVALVAFLPASAGEVVSAAFANAADRCVAMANQVLAFNLEAASECTMVVAPAQVGQPIPRDLFLARWAANVYVAPEDRSDPSDFDHLAGNPAAFPRHASHALASIADLWVGAGRDAPRVLATLAARQPSIAPAPVQVVRCFSRVLDYGYVVDHVAAGVFREEVAWPNPDTRSFDRIAQPDEILPDVAVSFLDKHKDVLGVSDCPPLTLEPLKRLKLLAALRMFIRLVIRRIRNKPFEMLENQLAKLHDAAADRIEQYSGGSILVKRHRDSIGNERGLLNVSKRIDRPLYVPDGPIVKTWTELRRLTLGLVDGGDIPPDIADEILRRGALRALVTNPPHIAPNPADKPPATEAHPNPRACDPLRFIEERGDAVDAAAPESHADADERDTSFLGLVGTGIAEALLKARREAAADLEPTDEQRAAWLAAEARRRRARQILGMKALCVTVAAAGLGYLAWTRLDLLSRIPVLALIFGLWVVLSAVLARRLLYIKRAAERELAQRQLDQLNGAMLRAQRAGDMVRLERRYEEFLDWSEILGWLAHRPWMAEPLDRIDSFGVLEPETVPAALQIGVTLQTDKHLGQLIGRGRARMFTAGWLGALYQAVEQRAMRDLALEANDAVGGGGLDLPDPADDVREDPESPRRRFLAMVVRGDGRHLDDNPLSQDLLGMIDSMPLDGVAHEVHVTRAGDEHAVRALQPAVGWFDPPEGLDNIAKPLRRAVADMQIGGADCAGAVVHGRVVTVQAGADERLRVAVADGPMREMSIACASGGLVLLEDAGEAKADTARSGEAGADDEFDAEEQSAAENVEMKADEFGDLDEPDANAATTAPAAEPGTLPVGFELSRMKLAVGEPVLGIGRDRTSWGLITAAAQGRPARVTFSAAVDRAGTPIVDLDGRLLGIQGRPPHARRGVVPPPDEAVLIGVEVVRRLLEGQSDGEPGVPPPQGAPRRRAATTAPTPTEFLSQPYEQGAGMALLPQHWTDNRDGHVIVEVAPERLDLSPANAHIGLLSAGARFHKPLRVLVHRVDLTHPVSTDQLSSCGPQELS
jgi:hypothetical protein